MSYLELALKAMAKQKTEREPTAKPEPSQVTCRTCKWAWWEGGKLADCLNRPWDGEQDQWAKELHPCPNYTPRPTCPKCGGTLLGPYMTGKVRCFDCHLEEMAYLIPGLKNRH